MLGWRNWVEFIWHHSVPALAFWYKVMPPEYITRRCTFQDKPSVSVHNIWEAEAMLQLATASILLLNNGEPSKQPLFWSVAIHLVCCWATVCRNNGFPKWALSHICGDITQFTFSFHGESNNTFNKIVNSVYHLQSFCSHMHASMINSSRFYSFNTQSVRYGAWTLGLSVW